MKKKLVFLPYDFDTAIGINNEGALVFSYNLEDTDQTEGGADVFNGQQSVLWNNLRMAFGDDIKAMYQTLRSTGVLSYEKVERMFEEHQAKWPEAVFNEDAWFKYLSPLVEEGSAAYLSMLQGSKAEQRKWWLYNRFRYMDSKYNAGDALTDVITVRGYAKADITVTPYADVYASIKYGSYLVQQRAQRNRPYTLPCPLDNVNDTEIYIYSASQLADVGDLSGLKVGYAEFSMATKLQNLKIGDAASTYSNGNLTELYLGNNELLRSLDVRNCPNLTQTVDISGCRNIERVYFDGTAITGLVLPNGGILKVLHLPGTITNLTIRNQMAITEFVLPSYENISTLRLENVSSVVDEKAILMAIPAGSRVRLIGFSWTAETAEDVFALMDYLDTMRGLDEAGNNLPQAQLSGTIYVPSLTGAELLEMNSRYPNIRITYEHISSYLYYYNYDGSQLLYSEQIMDGGNGTYTGKPSRAQTAQYTFKFAGWSRKKDQLVADPEAINRVTADRNVYAAYTGTVKTYTVRFYSGTTLLYTAAVVPYGSTAQYVGDTPAFIGDNPENYEFCGWSPSNVNITGNTECKAKFRYIAIEETITDSWSEIFAAVDNGRYITRYAIGDTKKLDLGAYGIAAMQIAAFDTDELADGTGTAHITWIAKYLLQDRHRYNPKHELVYEWPEVDSWGPPTDTNAYWTSKLQYTTNHAIATWRITATEAGTVSVTYKCSSSSTSYNVMNLMINGEYKAKNTASSSDVTFDVVCEAGDVVTVKADFVNSRDSTYYVGSVKFISTGAIEVEAEIEKATTRGDLLGYQLGTGGAGGWEASEIRSYLKEMLLPAIPAEVRSRILTVKKYQSAVGTEPHASVYQQETYEDVWIPSYKEVNAAKGGNNNYPILETDGPEYNELFADVRDTNKKHADGTAASTWLLRSVRTSETVYYITNADWYDYTINAGNGEYAMGVALSFCI